jgi:hypothetical protein
VLGHIRPQPRKGAVACDFMVSVIVSTRVFYLFVAMELISRRILHTDVTGYTTAEWSLQQFRECFTYDHQYRYMMHGPRFHLLGQPGRFAEGLWPARDEDPSSSAEGECVL